MTTYVLDTNIISLILRNNQGVQARFNQILVPQNSILGCPVVWYETRRGLIARDARRQLPAFDQVFSTFTWDNYTRQDWALASDLWALRRNKGLPVGDADLLIAVFARNREAILVTDNEKDFIDLGVTIENWTTFQP
jgi:tRNA(fMet)-specific endonuclease VapC